MEKQKTIIKLEKAILTKDFKMNKSLINHLKTSNEKIMPDWDDLTRIFLSQFVKYLINTLSKSSARTYCAYFKSVLNEYYQDVEIPCREFNKILNVRNTDSHNIYLTDAEIQKLIDYKPQNQKEKIIRNQFVTCCLTGIRYSDVISLDETNIVNDELHLFYQSQKTKAVIYTSNSDLINHYLSECIGHKYSQPTYNKVIREICEKLDIKEIVQVVQAGKAQRGEKYKYITSHTARRSFATNIYNATKDLMLVCRCMGHSDIKQTQRYVCQFKEGQEALSNYLNQFQKEQGIELI